MFHSIYATKLWDKLYDCLVPDQLTLNPTYIKKFGAHVTGDKTADKTLSKIKTHVKIPVAKILEYWEDGLEVEILSREDMIQMHKDMEGYLGEWKEHLKYAINSDLNDNKAFLLALENFSKHIYARAKPTELLDNLFKKKTFGLLNPLAQITEDKRDVTKLDYEGIGSLVRSKSGNHKPTGRF